MQVILLKKYQYIDWEWDIHKFIPIIFFWYLYLFDRCLLTGICLAAVIIGVVASLSLLAYKLATLGHKNSKDGPTVLVSHSVSTTNGYIHGLVEDGVHVFKVL